MITPPNQQTQYTNEERIVLASEQNRVLLEKINGKLAFIVFVIVAWIGLTILGALLTV